MSKSSNRNRTRARQGSARPQAQRPPHPQSSDPRAGYSQMPRPVQPGDPYPDRYDPRAGLPGDPYSVDQDDAPEYGYPEDRQYAQDLPPRRPAGARRPQDRRAPADAAQQGLAREIRVWWDGYEYVIGPEVADDVMLALALEQGKYITAMTGYLGSKQWDYYVATHSDPNGRVSIRDLEPFLQEIADQLGNS